MSKWDLNVYIDFILIKLIEYVGKDLRSLV